MCYKYKYLQTCKGPAAIFFQEWGWTQGFAHLGKHWAAPQPCSYALNNALCSFQLVFAVETPSLGPTHANLKQEPLWSEHLNTFFHVLHRCYSFSIFHFLGGFWWLWVSLKSIHFNTITKSIMRHKALPSFHFQTPSLKPLFLFPVSNFISLFFDVQDISLSWRFLLRGIPCIFATWKYYH